MNSRSHPTLRTRCQQKESRKRARSGSGSRSRPHAILPGRAGAASAPHACYPEESEAHSAVVGSWTVEDAAEEDAYVQSPSHPHAGYHGALFVFFRISTKLVCRGRCSSWEASLRLLAGAEVAEAEAVLDSACPFRGATRVESRDKFSVIATRLPGGGCYLKESRTIPRREAKKQP